MKNKTIILFLSLCMLVLLINFVTGQPIIDLRLEVHREDSVDEHWFHLTEGIPIDYYQEGGLYNLTVLDNGGNVIFNQPIHIKFEYHGSVEGPEWDYSGLVGDVRTLDYSLPYNSNMREFRLYHDNKLIFSKTLNFCNNNGVCDSSETYESCPSDCPLDENDVICIFESDGACDPDCGQGVDPDCVQEFYPNAGEDKTVFFKEPVSFHGEVTNPGVDTYNYEWFFEDDGSIATGQDVSHVFNNAGGFAVELKVTNQEGVSKTDTLLVKAKSCFLDDFVITDSVKLKSYEICETPEGIALAADNIIFDCNGAEITRGRMLGEGVNGFSFYNHKNITIKNCEVSGHYSNGILGVNSEGVTVFNNSFSSIEDGVDIEGGDDIYVSGNSFSDVEYCVEVSDSRNVHVLDNKIERAKVAISLDARNSLSEDSYIANNVIRDVSAIGISLEADDLEEVRNVVIENNFVGNVSGEFIKGIWSGFGVLVSSFVGEEPDGELTYSLVRNVTVRNNVVENAFNGIGLISSNFEDMSFGSILQDVSVIGNNVSDAGIHGISASNWKGGDEKAVIRNVLISDNDVTSLQYNPVNLYDVESLTMFNNVLKALMLGRAALSLQNTTYSIVSNNSMDGLIWLGDVKSSQIVDNVVKGYYRNGVYSLNSENVNLAGNVISVEPPVGIWGRAVYDEGSKDFYVRENVLKGPYNNQSSGVYLFSTGNSYVENNSLEGFYEGIVVKTNDSKVINNSVVWGAYGIQVSAYAALPDQTFLISIEDNVIDGRNVGPPVADYSYGIASFLNSDKGSLSIKKNVISNIGNPDDPYTMSVNGTNTNLGRGIRVDTDNSVVEDNLVENTTWAGIASNDGSNITFRNNVLKNAYGMLTRAWSEKCYNNLFENNVITGGSSAGVGGCGIEVRGCDNDIVRNNSISLVNSGIRTRSQGSFTSNNVLIEDNVVTSPEPARVFVDGWWGSQAYGVLLEDGGDGHVIKNNLIDFYSSGYPKNSESHGIGVYG